MSADDLPVAAMIETVKRFTEQLAELKQQEQQERDQLRRDIEAQTTALRHDVYGSILMLDQRQAEMHKTSEARYQETLIYRADDSHWRRNITTMVEHAGAATVHQVSELLANADRKRRSGQWRNTALLVALLGILLWLLLSRVL